MTTAKKAAAKAQKAVARNKAAHPLHVYASAVRAIHQTGKGTAETSYYPALNGLFDALGNEMTPKLQPVSQLSDPTVDDRFLPDFGLIEKQSQALVLPVEVKPADVKLERVASAARTADYARNYGGGLVLITNLWQFALARIVDGNLVEDVSRRVTIADSATDLLDGKLIEDIDLARTWSDLRMLLIDGGVPRGSIKTPKQVAGLLAYHARNMRDAIEAAGNPDEMLLTLRTALSEGLQIDLEGEHLVPTVVQTLVYGAFAAWLETDDLEHFGWMQSSYRLTVPVFAEILHQALRPQLLKQCDLTPHLQNVERVLRWTDRDAFTVAFDGAAIQYFYEPFLSEFDAVLRQDLGVWYTPREIADYQVARAHHHLVEELGIAEGLADRNVYLLDPAAGTGTYLIAACDFLVKYHIDNGEPQSVAAQRALEALLARFIGFEVLPAAFIICHLHLTRHLHQLGTNPGPNRLRVYLTNSLTGWKKDAGAQGFTLFPELEEELRDAAVAKQSDPVLVVLGNPPWFGYSTATTEEEREMMAEWSRESFATWNLRKHRLNDLYVRFWRVAIHRIVTLTQHGVVSFITNRKWIGGRSYPAMRATLVKEFDGIWVDDLHGGTHDRSTAIDQSIFTTAIAEGITVGTAVVTAVRTKSHSSDGLVHLADYRGTASEKRQSLISRYPAGLNDGYTTVTATKETRYRFTVAPTGDYPALDEYFAYFNSGVQPVRDEAVIAIDRTTLHKRMQDYYDSDLDFDKLLAAHPGFGVSRARYRPEEVRKALARIGAVFEDSRLVRYHFRPFDLRWMYWETEKRLLNESRRELYPYWRAVDGQISLVAAQTPRRVTGIRPLPSRAIASFESVDPNARVFPLYRPDIDKLQEETGKIFDTAAGSGATSVLPAWVKRTASVLNCDEKTAGESVFFALVAITNSPTWLDEQPVESDDFAQVPLPSSATALASAADLGRQLTDLFDPDTPVVGVTHGKIREDLREIATFDLVTGTVGLAGRHAVNAGTRSGESVLWSADKGWHNIPDEVWSFSIGGFQVLPKWLSYRTNTGVSEVDRELFRILCRRIAAIRSLENSCDDIYREAQINMLMPDDETDALPQPAEPA
ncbi:type ISP restriction/modification enzyme [Mycobacterium sp. GA-2829]|uniref:type ISP restriction/modification enzyme n=1 Tax=Mycobacterium sp. GA-2829 TaxID=1772283 RepID=UPI000AC1D3CF|nr:type ISP restriction/modification enzyme [Mycobacterium sp. GA-2829]